MLCIRILEHFDIEESKEKTASKLPLIYKNVHTLFFELVKLNTELINYQALEYY